MRWQVSPADSEIVASLGEELGLSVLPATALAARGLTCADESRLFLQGGLDRLSDPMLLPDASAAVERIREAVSAGQRIRVYGDYDCDGITSTALMTGVLRDMGADVDYRIPHRLRDGYGLKLTAVEEAAADDVNFLITVDCGSRAPDEVRRASELGIQVVVVDHHPPGEELPPAAALVNPRRPDSAYPYPHLAGVGVCYQLCRAVGDDDLTHYLDLVALGTVADVVPLTGDNRILVRSGLEELRRGGRPGVESLVQIADLELDEVDARDLAFVLGPRINAPGRLRDASPMVSMLLSTEPLRAQRIARWSDVLNERRRDMTARAVSEARLQLELSPDLLQGACLVLTDERWHLGIVGLVASRLAEEYRRPVVVVAPDPDDAQLLRGSGRSLGGLSLSEAFEQCAHLLASYGGHDHAAGVSIDRDNLEVFAEEMNRLARAELKPDDLLPTLEIVGEVPLKMVHEEAVRQLEEMRPFGVDNPRPLFLARDVPVKRARAVGSDKQHLALELDAVALRAIGFDMAEDWKGASGPRSVDLVFSPLLDTWRGRQRVQLLLKSFRPAGAARELVLAALRRRWKYLRRLYPKAEVMRDVYRCMQRAASGKGVDEAAAALEGSGAAGTGLFNPDGDDGRAILEDVPGIDALGLGCAMEVFRELRLVAPLERGDDRLWLLMPTPAENLALDDSPIYARGAERLSRLSELAEDPDSASASSLVRVLYGMDLGDGGPELAASEGGI